MSQVHYLQHFNLPLDLAEFIQSTPGCPDEPELITWLWAQLTPKVYWREAPIISHAPGKVQVGELGIDSVYLAKGLAQCHKATVLAVTIGQALPQATSKAFAQGEMYLGAIGDLVGSHSVEALADRFCAYLQGLALPQGLFPTLRYSPGYGDWAMPGQKDLMDFLQHCRGEIRLNENYLLEPVKSITALVGWSHTWQKPQYPQGDHGSGFCNGGHNCAACTTWACRK